MERLMIMNYSQYNFRKRKAIYKMLTDIDHQFIIEDTIEERLRYIQISVGRLMYLCSALPNHIIRPKILDVGCFPPCGAQMIMNHYNTECELFGISYDWHVWPGTPSEIREDNMRVFLDRETCFDIPMWSLNVEKDRFPFEDESFDIIICTEVVEHLLFSPTHLFYEANRVLKQGGILIVTTDNALNLLFLMLLLLNKNMIVNDSYSGLGPYGRHNRYFTRKELVNLIKGMNFEVVESKVYSHYFTLLGLLSRNKINRALLNLITWIISFGGLIPVSLIREKAGNGIFVKARKIGPPKAYYPDFLYADRHEKYLQKEGVII
jgi:SAM-dependent methyltransferase